MACQTQQECALCQDALTSSNGCREHIIPNAIGGRRTVLGFICAECNHSTGATWDAALAHQLHYFSLTLGISRQHGSVPPLTLSTVGGTRIRINRDGTRMPVEPSIRETTDGSATHLEISVADTRELRRTLMGLCRRYPQLRQADIEQAVEGARDGSYYSSDPMEVSVALGGAEAGRSLVKSAMALIFDAGVDPCRADLALDYLSNDDAEPCFRFFYGRDLVVERPARVIHVVHVRGCSDDGILIGYIELYGLLRIVLCLSETYGGDDFDHTYAIDPITGQEADVTIELDMPVSEIRETYSAQPNIAAMSGAVSDTLTVAQEIDRHRGMNRAITRAVDNAFDSSGTEEGDVLSDEQARRLIEDISEGLMPFIIHNLGMFRREPD